MKHQVQGLFIRSFQKADQTEVRRLVLDGLSEHFSQIDESLNLELQDIEGNYIHQGHLFIVAKYEEVLVGTGALLSLDDSSGQIVRVSVAAERRRQGIGEAIISRLLAFARERGYRRLFVETNLDWDNAIAFYRRLGFRPFTSDDVSLYMGLNL